MDKETELLDRLRQRDIKAFKALVIEYSESMERLAYALLDDRVKANDLVAALLVRLWNSGTLSAVEPPLHLFLFGEVRKASIGDLDIDLT
jgi:DNA-directed RNA polymerase specialized sigma24 family protein